MQSRPTGMPRAAAISGVTLAPRQHAAMAGLGPLAELELNHLDLWIAGVFHKFFIAERAIGVAAAKVARGNLPDQIATMLAVVYC